MNAGFVRAAATVFFAVLVASEARALELVVMAVNSGADITAPFATSNPPTTVPGAKGFLIGVRVTAADLVAAGGDELSLQDLNFTGVVHQVGVFDDGFLVDFPQIMTRDEAIGQGAVDGVNYVNNDSYVITNPQFGVSFAPVFRSGGLVLDDFLEFTGMFGIPTSVAAGDWMGAYIVATGDVFLGGTGFLALGTGPGALITDFLGMDTTLGPAVGAPADANGDGVVDMVDINFISDVWLGPGPAGDVNGDATVDIFDMLMVFSTFGAGAPPDPRAWTGDPRPIFLDFQTERFYRLPLDGDVNGDGAVDIFDVNLVSSNWEGPGPAGDANGDGIVDIFDVNLISSEWGIVYEVPAAVAVPEPSGRALAIFGVLATVVAMARNRRHCD